MKSPEAAWLMLCGAAGLHVLDEAVNGFLGFYNPLIRSIGWLPIPKLSFGVWISGLIAVIVIGVAATSSVTNRVRAMRWIGIIVAILMMLNGLAHGALSIVRGQFLPGTLSSPVLVVAAIWVIERFTTSWTSPVS